jgi:hypothetical protein
VDGFVLGDGYLPSCCAVVSLFLSRYLCLLIYRHICYGCSRFRISAIVPSIPVHQTRTNPALNFILSRRLRSCFLRTRRTEKRSALWTLIKHYSSSLCVVRFVHRAALYQKVQSSRRRCGSLCISFFCGGRFRHRQRGHFPERFRP